MRRLKSIIKKYERFLVPGMLLAGFVVDIITFRTLKIQTTFFLLGVHAILAGGAIMYSHFFDAKEKWHRFVILRNARALMPLLVQFTFGALLSASLVFYWFSGAFSASWPIMVLIAILMASNEVFRAFVQRSTVQMAIYAFALFSFSSLLFPYLFNSLSPWVFLLGGGVSTFFVLLFLFFLSRFTILSQAKQKRMTFSVIAIFIIMNGLYFANVIPPIPLSLREAGIYHDIQRMNGDYTLIGEEESLLDRLMPGQVVHAEQGERIYAFTSIFAPADLDTTIYHRWEFYDEETGKWRTEDRLSFSIRGGRDAGFRGYSYKTNLTEGKWRIFVETKRGQVLGIVRFRLETTP